LSETECTTPQGRRDTRPICFRPSREQFPASAFEPAKDFDLDQMQASMLDGRTVHFHFQFIEPVLLRTRSALAFAEPGLRAGALCPLRLCEAANPVLTTCRLGQIRTPDERIYGLYGDGTLQPAAHALIDEALACITVAGMDWLPALSVGGFVLDALDHHLCTVNLNTTMNGQQAAAATVEQAAHALASMWIAAEAIVVPRKAADVDRAKRVAADSMATLMGTELSSRTGSDVRYPPVGPALIEEALADYPLTRHLACFWNASWNRQMFLRGCEFDYAATLDALYEGWHG